MPFGLVGLLIWRWRCTHKTRPTPGPPFRGALYPLHGVARAAQPFPGPRAAIERVPEVHLHLPGVSAEDIAAILVRDLPQLDVNRQKPPHVP